MSYQCKYCDKKFVKETTLAHHACERKRRFQQQHELGVQWGFRAYQIFYNTTQRSKSLTYEDFVISNYYTAFVRFGRHCHSVHCVNFENFLRWLLKNNRKLDHWCQEKLYAEWLFDYLRRESVKDALERSIQSIADYMVEHPEYLNGYRDYFRLVNENRVCYHITTGRISVWIVYHAESGRAFLERLNTDQITMIMKFIDPDYWQSVFRDRADDVEFARRILAVAGL
jgi:hypothetical protein